MLSNMVCCIPDLSVGFPEAFVHLPYELRAGRTHEFADFEQVDDVVGGQHLSALADRRRLRLEFGEHGASGGCRGRQTTASPEVRPTYLAGCGSGHGQPATRPDRVTVRHSWSRRIERPLQPTFHCRTEDTKKQKTKNKNLFKSTFFLVNILHSNILKKL